MDKLLQCANVYKSLLDIEYNIVVAKKGKEYKLKLTFSPEEFHHLLGLKKLKDISEVRGNRERIFKKILNQDITYELISSSHFFSAIEKRFEYFNQVERLLDDNNSIIKFIRQQKGSKIDWKYLFVNKAQDNKCVYLFTDIREENKDTEILFGRSFFPKGTFDYEKGQMKTALLYKDKCNTVTKTKDIIYVNEKYKIKNNIVY